ncbi:FadR/GntR family transcriptional regulator [Pseudalkalibacillus sp. SCS-8]|uniref:FadR/GntR family transcriptional regulator n=1 Tax=Pseudalkalibacillus nanhaiensis TaxID=3115291 RepID=UPI0032DA3895
MTTKPHEKMFIEILNQLKTIIQTDRLQPGDKLPSERELSERLNVGRSSVREALRAMELLGLIETRRGEGTFIKQARNHRLVEVLASFILNDSIAKDDLTETRRIIEKNAVALAASRRTEEQLSRMVAFLSQMEAEESEGVSEGVDRDFFQIVFEAAHNSLLNRLWVELIEYDQNKNDQQVLFPVSDYKKIVEMIRADDHELDRNTRLEIT